MKLTPGFYNVTLTVIDNGGEIGKANIVVFAFVQWDIDGDGNAGRQKLSISFKFVRNYIWKFN